MSLDNQTQLSASAQRDGGRDSFTVSADHESTQHQRLRLACTGAQW